MGVQRSSSELVGVVVEGGGVPSDRVPGNRRPASHELRRVRRSGGGSRRSVEDHVPRPPVQVDVRERRVVREIRLGCKIQPARDLSERGLATLDHHVACRVVRGVLEVPDNVEGSLTPRGDGGIRLDHGYKEEEGQR